MLALPDRERNEKAVAATLVALIHAFILYAFLTGLGFAIAPQPDARITLFDIAAPPPPTEPAAPEKVLETETVKPKDPEGAAAPPDLEDTPVPVVAPTPKILLPIPPPIIAAPAPGAGNAPDAGAAPIPGPGTGRGGIGTGLGSGASGTGTGGGGGGIGRAARARHIAGAIYESDYPRAAIDRRASGIVYLRFTVAPTGRVSSCSVTRSSGSRALDDTTCTLIQRRFRYRPARDAVGRPVAETIRGEHEWDLAPEPPVREIEPDIVEEEVVRTRRRPF